MKYDIIIAGVGGQGVLSIGAVIAAGALDVGLRVKQSEEHGMAQRGGAVVSHLRMADGPIYSDLIPLGRADMIVSLEPLESLRYVGYLAPDGVLLTARDPVINFPTYPKTDTTLRRLESIPQSKLIDASKLSRQAGSGRATNMVMVGAASPALPLEPDTIETRIRAMFERKGPKVLEVNLTAFRLGREAVTCAAA
jgi:indolepyruvate ferredoxin oxidoreductase beta subunit